VPKRFTVVRLTLGMLLLAAAGLKLYGLSVSAVPQVGWFAQPWVQLAAAEWELILGLWLLSGSHQRGAWLAALLTFVAFVGVSGYLGSVGVASCGCFGMTQASPWLVSGLDVLVLTVLGWTRPPRVTVYSPSGLQSGVRLVFVANVIVVVVTTGFALRYGSLAIALARLRGEPLTVQRGYLDLGIVSPGTIVFGTVKVTNWSHEPVRIIGGTSDCACTVIDDLPLTIPANEMHDIRIKMVVPESSIGQLTRSIVFRTNCSAQPLVTFRLGCRVTEAHNESRNQKE
jgi:hypothetical protein